MELQDRIKMLIEKNEFEVHMSKNRKGEVISYYYDAKGKKHIVAKDRDDMYNVHVKLDLYDQQDTLDTIMYDFIRSNKSKDVVSVLDHDSGAFHKNIPMLLQKYGYRKKLTPERIDDKSWVGDFLWSLGGGMYLLAGNDGRDSAVELLFRKDDGEYYYNKILFIFDKVKDIPKLIKIINKYYGKMDKVTDWDHIG